MTKTDGPRTALGDGDATSVAVAVTLGAGLGEGEVSGVAHATTSAPTNNPTADRIHSTVRRQASTPAPSPTAPGVRLSMTAATFYRE